jgi:hypothetical protein
VLPESITLVPAQSLSPLFLSLSPLTYNPNYAVLPTMARAIGFDDFGGLRNCEIVKPSPHTPSPKPQNPNSKPPTPNPH